MVGGGVSPVRGVNLGLFTLTVKRLCEHPVEFTREIVERPVNRVDGAANLCVELRVFDLVAQFDDAIADAELSLETRNAGFYPGRQVWQLPRIS